MKLEDDEKLYGANVGEVPAVRLAAFSSRQEILVGTIFWIDETAEVEIVSTAEIVY